MAYLNLDKLRAAKVETDPYQYVVVPGFLSPEVVQSRSTQPIPRSKRAARTRLRASTQSMMIKSVIAELDGKPFEDLIAEKFSVELANRPKMYSLRGYTRAKDGSIHTDSKDKIITVLVYLNENWQQPGGRLRILRDGQNVDNFVAEVPPDNGTLLVFKRSDKSWHGHHPFEGQRRSLQMNWMTSEGTKGFHAFRHKVSAAIKKLTTA